MIEIQLRSYLFRAGLRFRCCPSNLPGKPDILFPTARVAVFVHGCFWHQHSCRKGHMPNSNRMYWEPKLAGNVARDARNTRRLRTLGYSVLTVWECRLLAKADSEGRRVQRTVERRSKL